MEEKKKKLSERLKLDVGIIINDANSLRNGYYEDINKDSYYAENLFIAIVSSLTSLMRISQALEKNGQ